jgi:cytochrome c oxidase assembly protein subunit 15
MNTTTPTAPAVTTFPGAGRLAIVGALYTYGVIIIAGLVRVTAARETPIAQFLNGALAVGFLLVGSTLLAFAFRRRQKAGFAGPHSVFRAMVTAGTLSIGLAIVDAIVVRIPGSPHLWASQYLLALLLLAALLVAAVRAGTLGAGLSRLSTADNARRAARTAVGTVAFGFIVVVLGVITAYTPAAPEACQGFPLCNGSLLPRGDSPTLTHWAHRMLAFLLLLHVIGAFFTTRRRAASAATLRAALASLTAIILQVLVAGALLGMHLAPALQVTHLVVGMAFWSALVCWGALARRDLREMGGMNGWG